MKKAERAAQRAAQENLVVQILSWPGRLQCEPLAARISERQCLVNQTIAGAKVKLEMSTGRLAVCLDCATGREVAARHPEGLEVERRDVYGIPMKFKWEPLCPPWQNGSPPAANHLEKISTAPETRTIPDAAGGGRSEQLPEKKTRRRRLPKWWAEATPAVRKAYLRDCHA